MLRAEPDWCKRRFFGSLLRTCVISTVGTPRGSLVDGSHCSQRLNETPEDKKQWHRLPTGPWMGHKGNTSYCCLSALMGGKYMNRSEHRQHVQGCWGNDHNTSNSSNCKRVLSAICAKGRDARRGPTSLVLALKVLHPRKPLSLGKL